MGMSKELHRLLSDKTRLAKFRSICKTLDKDTYLLEYDDKENPIRGKLLDRVCLLGSGITMRIISEVIDATGIKVRGEKTNTLRESN